MATESVPEAFLIHSGMEIVYADHNVRVLLGMDSREGLAGTSLTDLVASEYHASFSEQVARVENGDAPALGMTVEFRTPAGQRRRSIVVSSRIDWEGTERVHTSAFPIAGTDSDDRRLLYDLAMDEAPVGITISDPSQPDNPLIYVNDHFCELTGHSRDEVLGQNCRFLQGEATREESVARMREAIEAEDPVTVELRNYRKDGSMFWNRVTIVPVRSEDGTVTNYLGYQQDVTDKRRYQRDLSLFKTQAEGSDKAVLITDPEGTIEYVNPAFEELTGYTAAEATGHNPRILKSGRHDEEFYSELWETITAGEVWETDLTNLTKHGEFFEAEQKIIPVTDEDDEITHFIGILQDVTEEMLTTQKLSVLNRVLRHNLRNALNTIDGHAELLETEDLDPEARQASLTAIRDQAASLQTITEKTAEIRTAWEAAERGTWERLDVESLVETYRRRYPDANVTATVVGDANARLRNVDLFTKALDEAVENAVKHVDRPQPNVTITVQRDADANQLRISVADDGPGIPELERRAIQSGEETQLAHSLGVGLWMMEWITTTLSGELEIADNRPEGSVVTFRLPTPSRTSERDRRTRE